jgi:hypothetical protein
MEDKLSLLKSLLLVRRGDLRPYIHYTVLFQDRYEALIPLKQRDLLISFPSVNKEVYNLIFSLEQNYGSAGKTAVLLSKDQVGDHLDRTEMFRIDLDSLLSKVPAIVPQNRELIKQCLENAHRSLTEQTFKFNIVTLADHAFLSIIPSSERSGTFAVAQIRQYLQEEFREHFEENLIEFFVVGGGYLRFERDHILIGGRSLMFDPIFVDTTQPISELYASHFLQLKFQLAQQILKAEMPEYQVAINQGNTGKLSAR